MTDRTYGEEKTHHEGHEEHDEEFVSTLSFLLFVSFVVISHSRPILCNLRNLCLLFFSETMTRA